MFRLFPLSFSLSTSKQWGCRQPLPNIDHLPRSTIYGYTQITAIDRHCYFIVRKRPLATSSTSALAHDRSLLALVQTTDGSMFEGRARREKGESCRGI
ncbi:hypothetical protein NL676_039208 [Syzygium grande]|nr:hypothetical protein NL676_039208 [Syzygium grande]